MGKRAQEDSSVQNDNTLFFPLSHRALNQSSFVTEAIAEKLRKVSFFYFFEAKLAFPGAVPSLLGRGCYLKEGHGLVAIPTLTPIATRPLGSRTYTVCLASDRSKSLRRGKEEKVLTHGWPSCPSLRRSEKREDGIRLREGGQMMQHTAIHACPSFSSISILQGDQAGHGPWLG